VATGSVVRKVVLPDTSLGRLLRSALPGRLDRGRIAGILAGWAGVTHANIHSR